MTATRETRHEGVVIQGYRNERDAENAVRALRDAGFTTDEISVMAQEEGRAASVTDATGEDVAAGTGIGAATGGVLGGIVGLLLGAAAVTIPGVGIVVAGPLAAALGGAGLGAITGGIAGALTSIGVADDDAQHFQERYEAGEILIVVAAGGRENEARLILESDGTSDIPLV